MTLPQHEPLFQKREHHGHRLTLYLGRGRMKELREAVIVDAVRTPIGKRNGSLAGLRPDVVFDDS